MTNKPNVEATESVARNAEARMEMRTGVHADSPFEARAEAHPEAHMGTPAGARTDSPFEAHPEAHTAGRQSASATPTARPMPTPARQFAPPSAAQKSGAAFGATAALVALIVLSIAWEWWLAPLRPGGSALVLKAVPLLLALPGVWRQRLYTLQWASMLILLYFAEGVVRGWSDRGLSARLGWLEAALAVVFFVCTLLYVGPFKRAAKRAAKLHREHPGTADV